MDDYYEQTTYIDQDKLWNLLNNAVSRPSCDEDVIEAFNLLDAEKKEKEKQEREAREAREKRIAENERQEKSEKKKDEKAIWIVQSAVYYHGRGRGENLQEALNELEKSEAQISDFYNSSFVFPIYTGDTFMYYRNESDIPESRREEYENYKEGKERGYLVLKYPEETDISQLPKVEKVIF